MQRYRRKGHGVIVEAAKVSQDNVTEIANWAQAQIVEEQDALDPDAVFEALNIKTPEGKKRASQGQYVAKVNGQFFVVSRSSFESKYEPLMSTQKAGKQAAEERQMAVYRAALSQDPFDGMTRMNEGPRP